VRQRHSRRSRGARPGVVEGEGLTGTPGRLYAGTSGFSYADWIPRFYPPGTRATGLLRAYAEQLPAVELNATFRRRPTTSAIRGWVAATPPGFRFVVKAQRSSAIRGLFGSPAESVAWLTEPLDEFGDRLGAVLYRVPAEIRRDGPWIGGDPERADERLRALLAAWPRGIPLVVELQDRSWHVDETFAALRETGAVLCATELPPEGDEGATVDGPGSRDAAADPDPPIVRRTGSFLYVRLRRHDYSPAELDAWAARLQPFLAAGDDVYAFFRHDAVGRAAELALELLRRLPER
jgi:uncharacterized protein YecE (DUF72 family)